jgi:hypothetical protein
MTNFEIDTRAPLIISIPGMKIKGMTTRRLNEFVDIYPSLSELAGLPVPEALAKQLRAGFKLADYHYFVRRFGIHRFQPIYFFSIPIGVSRLQWILLLYDRDDTNGAYGKYQRYLSHLYLCFHRFLQVFRLGKAVLLHWGTAFF